MMGSSDMKHIETVKDLITALLDYNQDATVCIGNNFDNRVALGWSGGDGCKKKDCQYLCLDMADGENVEQETKVEEPKFEDTAKTSSLKAILRGVRNGYYDEDYEEDFPRVIETIKEMYNLK